MEQGTCSIGVDMGTTDVKAIAFTDDGRIVAREDARLAMLSETPGAAEQDPQAVYDSVTGVFADAAHQAHSLGYRVARVGVSAAMHSLLAIGQDDKPLTRALTWMDTRPASQADALWATPQGKAIYARTGTPIHAMSPLSKLLWLRQTHPDLLKKAARFVSLKEYIWHGWFGSWQIDASIASATGLYNLKENAWDAEALSLAGITTSQLSELTPTTTARDGLREQRLLSAGLAAETPFTIGASDGTLANLGVGALSEERMALTIGTSSAARVGVTAPQTDPKTRPFCYVLAEGRFVVGEASNNGGAALDWLARRAFPGPADVNGLLNAAEKTNAGDLLFLPYLSGERSPLWDAHAQGAFVGLNTQTDAVQLARAVIEGIAFNACWIADDLIATVGRPQMFIASGRLLETGWIRQLVADISGIPVAFPAGADASTLGAVTLAAIASGALTWDAAIQQAEQRLTTHMQGQSGIRMAHPRPDAHQAFQERYARFKRVVAALQASAETT